MKTSREIAAEIYTIPYNKRAELLEKIPYPQRADVEQHMRNFAKRDQIAATRKASGVRTWDKRVKTK